MWVELEIVEEHHRSDKPVQCSVCERLCLYVVGAVIARAYPLRDLGGRVGEAVCPKCIEAGPEAMAERLEEQAYWNRQVADEAEELADEGVEAPTPEDLRLMKEIANL
jgi:hypothetical protein